MRTIDYHFSKSFEKESFQTECTDNRQTFRIKLQSPIYDSEDRET